MVNRLGGTIHFQISALKNKNKNRNNKTQIQSVISREWPVISAELTLKMLVSNQGSKTGWHQSQGTLLSVQVVQMTLYLSWQLREWHLIF